MAPVEDRVELREAVKKLDVFCMISISYDQIMREGGVCANLANRRSSRGDASDDEDAEAGDWAEIDVDKSVAEQQEKFGTFLNEIMKAGEGEEEDGVAPEFVHARMEQEASEVAQRREAASELATQALQERTVYLNKVIKMNDVASATLNKFMSQIAVQSQHMVASDRRLEIWQSQICELVAKSATALNAEPSISNAMIAILGDSGSGKSSILKALLLPNSEGVLPMSGARACTAAPIAITYSAGHGFEARIEFPQHEDGNLKRNLVRLSSENGRIAYDKIHSVYGYIAPLSERVKKGGVMEGRLEPRDGDSIQAGVVRVFHECKEMVESVSELRLFIQKASVGLFALKAAIEKIDFDRSGSKLSVLPKIDELVTSNSPVAANELVDFSVVRKVLKQSGHPGHARGSMHGVKLEMKLDPYWY
ncbi:hypothetical protein HDU98_004976 [Podochytrium sp. JEL0797]|nr:hypothetical protein HDU98_004976 [Podochytrium sp. JEL0797]